MKNIGGFFELELPEGDTLYHDEALALSTGRACIHFVMKARKPSKVYVPFYCCDALFEPLEKLQIKYEFYSIDSNLEVVNPPKLNSGELIICCDFFGVKTNYIRKLADYYGEQLVIDNTHAFFQKRLYPKIASFTSARKYFGVPDGAFLYSPDQNNLKVTIPQHINISLNHSIHRLLELQELAYEEYIKYEKSLGSEIEKISILSKRLLSLVDYKSVRLKRNENYRNYHEILQSINVLNISGDEKDCFCYPLLLEKPIDKKRLYEHGIFIPNLWLDTIRRKESTNYPTACKLSEELLPLPIDHRYDSTDIERVCSILSKVAES